jgi:fluoroquinolone resistance protein
VLSYANFSGLDLRKSSLKDCVAREADFAETDLEGADLRGTDFTGARFTKTNLVKADLRHARSYAIRPGDNKIRKAKFSLPEATLLLYGLDIELEE